MSTLFQKREDKGGLILSNQLEKIILQDKRAFGVGGMLESLGPVFKRATKSKAT